MAADESGLAVRRGALHRLPRESALLACAPRLGLSPLQPFDECLFVPDAPVQHYSVEVLRVGLGLRKDLLPFPIAGEDVPVVGLLLAEEVGALLIVEEEEEEQPHQR